MLKNVNIVENLRLIELSSNSKKQKLWWNWITTFGDVM